MPLPSVLVEKKLHSNFAWAYSLPSSLQVLYNNFKANCILLGTDLKVFHSIIEGTVHVENQQFLIRRCPYTQTPQEVEF